MSLHDRIMARKRDLNECGEEKEYFERLEYNCAINDAAQIAKQADELMEEMADLIASVDPDQLTAWQQDRFSSSLIRYTAWKEKNK